MSDNNIRTITIEEFIIAFNRFEADENLFSLQDKQGYPWWDLVRYRVQYSLCVERKLLGYSSAPMPSTLIRATSFAKQAWRLIRVITQLRVKNFPNVSTIIVTQRPLNYISDIVEAESNAGNFLLCVNKTGMSVAPHVAFSAQSLQFATRLFQKTQLLPKDIAQKARQLSGMICDRFGSKLDIFELIAQKYREELILRCFWKFILDRVPNTQYLVYVNDDLTKSLVFQAHARSIDIEEVQHAYMGRSHIAFSYPKLQINLDTLPDRIIITRDSGDIIYPAKKVFVKTKNQPIISVPRDIDVLVASSPRRFLETIETVQALVGKGLRLGVKLHPAQSQRAFLASELFSSKDVQIYGGDEDFSELASRTICFIPASPTSTTLFEASEMGARVILIDRDGMKTTAISDSVASACASSLQVLFEVIKSQIVIFEENVDHVTGCIN